MTKLRRIKFGDLVVGPLARRKIAEALDGNWVTEGPNVAEFERRYAEKFGWRYCIATSSGTTAGEVVWAAVRELNGKEWGNGIVLTPACAFAATANCLLASGCNPRFVDVNLETLNMDVEALKGNTVRIPSNLPTVIETIRDKRTIGVNFVATMGKPTPIHEIALLAKARDLYVIGDFCEAHGAMLCYPDSTPISATPNKWYFADHLCDVTIYSFYVAHMIVGGEGGMICTDDDEIAELCRSIKSHGRPAGSNFFQFDRVGFNAKANELTMAIAIESLEKFDENFERRRITRKKLLERLSEFPLILFPDGEGEVIAPHAFPILLADENGDIGPLYKYLEVNGIECKTLWGALSNHKAFQWIGIPRGTFPVAERVGNTGLHFSCSEFMTDEDIEYIAQTIRKFFLDNA